MAASERLFLMMMCICVSPGARTASLLATSAKVRSASAESETARKQARQTAGGQQLPTRPAVYGAVDGPCRWYDGSRRSGRRRQAVVGRDVEGGEAALRVIAREGTTTSRPARGNAQSCKCVVTTWTEEQEATFASEKLERTSQVPLGVGKVRFLFRQKHRLDVATHLRLL